MIVSEITSIKIVAVMAAYPLLFFIVAMIGVINSFHAAQ